MIRSIVLGLMISMALAAHTAAQNQGAFADDPYQPNVKYDGRFTFVRIRYTPLNDGGGFGRFRGGRNDPKWDHDYAKGERHFSKILAELTTLRARTENTNILTLDDPELFKFPVAYLCEPGFWNPSDKEVAGLRSYLTKGGFIIFDDFVGNQIYNLEGQLRKVLPEARMIPLTPAHPLFDAFYRIPSLDYVHPYFGQPSIFFGIFVDNDPTKRLMAVINYTNDISEYWEWSDTGQFAIDLSNDAYKLGVNYVVYALTR